MTRSQEGKGEWGGPATQMELEPKSVTSHVIMTIFSALNRGSRRDMIAHRHLVDRRGGRGMANDKEFKFLKRFL